MMADEVAIAAPQQQQQKNPIEALSKEELLNKYKSLLNIAKKAKQAKDDYAEENRKIKEKLSLYETQKESDKRSILTMKEMVEEFTEKKLLMSTELSDLKRKSKIDEEKINQLEIENESLKRQQNRLNEENETLLTDLETMEQQLRVLGQQQKHDLDLLEIDVIKLTNKNAQLRDQLDSSYKEQFELKEKYQSIKEINSEQCKKFNALKERFIDVHRKLKKLKECKCVLLETQHDYAESVTKWQSEIIQVSQMLCEKINTLQFENDALKHNPNSSVDVPMIAQKLKEMHLLSANLCEEQERWQSERQCLIQELNDLKTQLKDNELKFTSLEQNNNLSSLAHREEIASGLQQEIEGLKAALLQSSNEHEMQCATKSKELEVYLSENAALKSIVENLKDQLAQHELSLASFKETETQQLSQHIEEKLRDKNDKLSHELNTVKEQLLKAQVTEAKVEDLEAERKDLLQRLENLQKLNDDLKTHFELKEREHADLLDEMRELNEALKGRGDVISRQQEHQQELVNELKIITNKFASLETELNVEKQSKQELSIQLEQLHLKFETLETELQNLRQQEANADAQSDILSTSTTSRGDELNRLREFDDTYEEKYNKLRGLAAKLKKKLIDQSNFMGEMEKELTGTNALKAEVALTKEELVKTQKEMAMLKAENQKLKLSRKQANVLNLEIEAAEKSLADVSAKLTIKTQELETLNVTLNTKENLIEQLRKEMNILEAAKEAEATHGKQLKDQIDLMQTQVKDAVHSQQQAILENKTLTQNIEQLKLELEDAQLQLAHNTQQHEVALKDIIAIKDTLAVQLHGAEAQIQTLEGTLKNTERVIEDIRIEFLDYKVKAQAVLRKNKNNNISSSKERELQEELSKLRESEIHLQAQLKTLQMRINQIEKQNEQLQEDNNCLQRQTRELHNIVKELREQNELLTHENQQHLQKEQEILRQHKVALNKLETEHMSALEMLQQKLQHNENLITATTIAAANVNATTTSRPIAVIGATQLPGSSDQSKIEFLLMEREAAEGSEEAVETTLAQLAAKRKISTSSRRSQHDFMPLDELLNTPIAAMHDKVTTVTSNLSGDSKDNVIDDENAHLALQVTQERLQMQESRVRHLTALLAENEQDLAKLTQMNDMLKEELRRQERSAEREQHMHNSEYLKNVFLKFLTLSNGDERMRLVPVLNTILKLSRSEAEMLNCVAKGQKIPNDVNNRSWGSFLTAWTSGGTNPKTTDIL